MSAVMEFHARITKDIPKEIMEDYNKQIAQEAAKFELLIKELTSPFKRSLNGVDELPLCASRVEAFDVLNAMHHPNPAMQFHPKLAIRFGADPAMLLNFNPAMWHRQVVHPLFDPEHVGVIVHQPGGRIKSDYDKKND